MENSGDNFEASGSMESDDGFTLVSHKRRKKMLTIDVSPNNILGSRNLIRELSDRQRIAEYTRDKDKNILHETKYAILRDLPQSVLNGSDKNLLTGFGNAVKPKERKLKTPKFSIKWILHYLLHNRPELLDQQSDFVCAVSTLRLLMCACYEQREVREWRIYATKVNGRWFLSEGWPDYKDGVDFDVKYAARMFEVLRTVADDLEQAAKLSRQFLQCDKTYEYWSARLGEHHLLYSGDVDCLDQNRESSVELKVTTKWQWANGKKNIEPATLRRSWAQAHLMGNKQIIFGCLKRDGTEINLEGTEEIDTDSVKQDASAIWNTDICMACLDKILTSIKVDDFFQDKEATYELWLDRKKKEITAKVSTVNFPPELLELSKLQTKTGTQEIAPV